MASIRHRHINIVLNFLLTTSQKEWYRRHAQKTFNELPGMKNQTIVTTPTWGPIAIWIDFNLSIHSSLLFNYQSLESWVLKPKTYTLVLHTYSHTRPFITFTTCSLFLLYNFFYSLSWIVTYNLKPKCRNVQFYLRRWYIIFQWFKLTATIFE